MSGRRRAVPRRPSRRRPVALTGTPGVGKSSVARRLGSRWRATEVSDLALRLGVGRRVRGAVEVDLPGLRRALARLPEPKAPELLVGHLAHLLPVREAIVLRCHPAELAARLRRAHRGNRSDREANVVSETVDLVLVEAAERRVPVFEIDTTGRTVASVAREVASRLRRGGRPRAGTVDWLGDGRVTAHLLDGTA